MKKGGALLLVAIAVVTTQPGCTVMRSVELLPQSHFTPPNSNVEPIGEVTGQASSGGLNIDFGAEIVRRAYRDAMAKKGGDLLINATVRRKASVFIIFYSTTVTVKGTAARMKLGKQQLSQVQDEQIRRLVLQAAP